LTIILDLKDIKKKLRNTKYRQLGIPSLFIVGGGFAILIFIGLFVLNYDNHRKINTSYSYSELKERNTLVKANDIYDFMNYALFGADSILTDSM
jgi:hypothetical protein